MDLFIQLLRLIMLLFSLLGYFYYFKGKFAWPAHLMPFFVLPLTASCLYIFAYFNLLEPGAYLIFTIGLILFVRFLYHLKRDLQNNISYPDPAIIIFILIFFGLWFYFRNALYMSNDEFSHWGLVVKEMYLKNGFAGADSSLLFPDYPPGVALFLYYVAKIVGYSEGVTYFAHFLLILSGLLVLLKDICRKTLVNAAFILLLLLWLLMFFFDLHPIHVDPILAVMFGAALTSYFTSETSGKKSIFYLLPTLFFIPLIKQIGMFFGLLIGFIIIFDQIITRQKLDSASNSPQRLFYWKRLLVFCLVFLLPFLAYGTWNHLQVKRGTNKSFKTPISFQQIKNSFSPDTVTKRDKETISAFVKAPSERYFFPKFNLYRILFIYTLIALLSLFLQNSRKQKMSAAFTYFILLGGFAAYAFIHLIVFMYAFGEHEGVNLGGYQRYMGTYLFGWALLLLGLFKPLQWQKFTIILFTGLFFMLNSYIGISLQNYISAISLVDSSLRLEVKQLVSLEKQKIYQNPGKTWIIWQENDGLEFRIARFELAPIKTNEWCWSLGDLYFKEDLWTVNYSPQEWASKLQEYDYVLIIKSDEQFWQKYGSVFIEPVEARSKKLFRIIKNNGGLPVLKAV